MNYEPKCVTREKHLDHMVKVVPFIVMGYALQCYIIYHFKLTGFATNSLMVLGAGLAVMVAGFYIYTMTHKVDFHTDGLTIKFLGKNQKILYSEILVIEVAEEGQSFATLSLTLKDNRNFKFYLIDDADKVRDWLQSKKFESYQKKAA